MNGGWGFNITDVKFKSVPELIGYLVRAAGNGGNLLLNVGPRPDGTIQPEAVERLQAIGTWLQTYGPSIYDTRRGPIPPQPWGATTQRGQTVFVHVLDGSLTSLSLPSIGARVTKATLLGRNLPITIAVSDTGLTLTLPAPGTDEPARVVALETAVGHGASRNLNSLIDGSRSRW
jgi:alpha-L-fucosidase